MGGFLRGLSAGVTGIVLGGAMMAGVTLLLHPGPGALATAGLLIALALGALATAVWVGSAERGRDGGGVGWMIVVLVILAAGPFAQFWMQQEPLREASWGRAAAVLILVALPAYGLGFLFTSLQRRGAGVIMGALAGTAVGAAVASTWLIPKFDPGILYAGAGLLVLGASWLAVGARVADGGYEMEGRVPGLAGKVAIVTGVGSPGQVGYAVVEGLVAEGVRVVMTARSPEVVEAAEGVDGVVGIAADLTVPEEVERIVELARERFGRLDILVNVAGGLTVTKPLSETTPEEWEQELERNAQTAFIMSRAALPLLRESQGAIINFASPAGLRAQPGIGAYSAGKAAVVALTRALALEERKHGIRVNAIAPGMIDTEQNRATVEDPDSVRMVTRRQVVDTVLFLASELGDGVNGETVEVRGRS